VDSSPPSPSLSVHESPAARAAKLKVRSWLEEYPVEDAQAEYEEYKREMDAKHPVSAKTMSSVLHWSRSLLVSNTLRALKSTSSTSAMSPDGTTNGWDERGSSPDRNLWEDNSDDDSKDSAEGVSRPISAPFNNFVLYPPALPKFTAKKKLQHRSATLQNLNHTTSLPNMGEKSTETRVSQEDYDALFKQLLSETSVTTKCESPNETNRNFD